MLMFVYGIDLNEDHFCCLNHANHSMSQGDMNLKVCLFPELLHTASVNYQ